MSTGLFETCRGFK